MTEASFDGKRVSVEVFYVWENGVLPSIETSRGSRHAEELQGVAACGAQAGPEELEHHPGLEAYRKTAAVNSV